MSIARNDRGPIRDITLGSSTNPTSFPVPATDANFRDCVALECRAMNPVHEEMWLTNVEIMSPFVRIPGQGAGWIQALEENGLRPIKYIGICGQGPSDHSSLARCLPQQAIESISLNPDTVVDTWLLLAEDNSSATDDHPRQGWSIDLGHSAPSWPGVIRKRWSFDKEQ